VNLPPLEMPDLPDVLIAHVNLTVQGLRALPALPPSEDLRRIVLAIAKAAFAAGGAAAAGIIAERIGHSLETHSDNKTREMFG